MANEKTYICGGVKYHFEEKDGKLHLLSLEIWNKLFVLPNGGIPEQTVEVISQAVEETITKTNEDGRINRLEEIKEFLSGYPEGTSLEEVLADVEQRTQNSITEEINSRTIGEEAAHSMVADLIAQHEQGGNTPNP